MSLWHTVLSATIFTAFMVYAWRAYRRPVEVFSPPLLACAAFFFLYVMSYITSPQVVNDYYITRDAYGALLVVSNLFIFAFIIGYNIGANKTALALRNTKALGKIPFFYIFAVFLVAAISKLYFVYLSGGFERYYSEIHGTAGAWEEVSAYLYRLESFLFTVLYLTLARRLLGNGRGVVELVVLLSCLAWLAFEAIVFGNRGDTVRFVMVFGISYLLLTVHPPGRLMLFGGISIAVIAVLVFPMIRDALHLGADRSLSVALSESLDALVEPATSAEEYHFYSPPRRDGRPVSGSGLYIAAAMVDGAYATGRYGWTDWLFVFVSFVPRHLWPEKHMVMGRWFTNQKRLLIDSTIHWSAAGGSSSTGVADTFTQFSGFGVVVWFLIGFWGGKSWNKARAIRDILPVGTFIAYMIFLTYFVLQGFGAAFSQWLYFAVPLWGARILFSGRTPMGTRRDPASMGPSRELKSPRLDRTL